MGPLVSWQSSMQVLQLKVQERWTSLRLDTLGRGGGDLLGNLFGPYLVQNGLRRTIRLKYLSENEDMGQSASSIYFRLIKSNVTPSWPTLLSWLCVQCCMVFTSNPQNDYALGCKSYNNINSHILLAHIYIYNMIIPQCTSCNRKCIPGFFHTINIDTET